MFGCGRRGFCLYEVGSDANGLGLTGETVFQYPDTAVTPHIYLGMAVNGGEFIGGKPIHRFDAEGTSEIEIFNGAFVLKIEPTSYGFNLFSRCQ